MKSAKVESEVGLGRNGLAICKLLITIVLSLSILQLAPSHSLSVHGEAVTRTIFVGMNPDSIGVNTSTNKIYVSNYGNNGTIPGNVTVVDGSSHSILTTVTVGFNPAGLGVNSVTNRVYVANYNASSISVISGSTDTVTETITVGAHPSQISVNVATNEIYVTNSGDNTVSVINGTTNNIVTTIPVGRHPGGIGLLTSTDEIYVSDSQDNAVSVINGQTNSVIATIPVGNGPGNIGADPSTSMIYVVDSNSYNGNVTVINGSSNTVVRLIPVGPFPTGIGVNPTTGKVYVANSPDLPNLVDGTVSLIDEFTGEIVNTICLSSQPGCLSARGGIYPGAVSVDPVTNEVYVAKASSKTIFVISGHPTTTSVACNPASIGTNMKTACTATISDISGSGASTPTGTVFFSSNGQGIFNATSCALAGTGTMAACSISYSPTVFGSGHQTLFATYSGDSAHMSSSGNTVISLIDSTVGGVLIPRYPLPSPTLFVTITLLFYVGIITAILYSGRLRRNRSSNDANTVGSNHVVEQRGQ